MIRDSNERRRALSPNTLPSVLDEIAHAIPRADISTLSPTGTKFVAVSLPYGCALDGALTISTDHVVAEATNVMVPNLLGEHGIGTRLIRTFTAFSKDEGASVLVGSVISPYALKAMRGIFHQHIQIQDSETNENVTLPFDQALHRLEINERKSNESFAFGEQVEIRPGVEVIADLQAINTEGWERPMLSPPIPVDTFFARNIQRSL